MYIFRFMSAEEFNKYLNNEPLINRTSHSRKSKTDSIGFCFFAEDEFYKKYSDIERLEHVKWRCKYSWEFLCGAIPDPKVCCIFQIDENIIIRQHLEDVIYQDNKITNPYLVKGYGIYADPDGTIFDILNEIEYSCQWYDKNSFKLVSYCTNFSKFYKINLEVDWKWLKI